MRGHLIVVSNTYLIYWILAHLIERHFQNPMNSKWSKRIGPIFSSLEKFLHLINFISLLENLENQTQKVHQPGRANLAKELLSDSFNSLVAPTFLFIQLTLLGRPRLHEVLRGFIKIKRQECLTVVIVLSPVFGFENIFKKNQQ